MKRLSRWLLVFAACLACGGAIAQSYPTRPVRMVVPYPPGGGADAVARLLAQKLGESTGQSFVVENRPGANGNIGSDIVAKAAPDGYTILVNTIGLVLSQSIYKSLPFNVLNDFTPVVLIAEVPHVLIVNPAVKANSVSELVALAKAEPGKLDFASVGTGSPFQMAAQLFMSMADVRMQEIPYQGGGPAVTSVIAGTTSVTFANLLAALPQVSAGKVRALAVTGAKRTPAAPDIPTMNESGVPGYDFSAWVGIWAPRGTPSAIVDKLNGEVGKILQSPDVRARLEKEGATIAGGTPADFDRYIRNEYAKWDKVVKNAGISSP